jgi:hypothetical protein
VLKGGKQHAEIWTSTPKKLYLKAKKQKETEMQERQLYSQTGKKVCDAPAIKSSRSKKPAVRNLNKIFSDSSSEDDSADERNICDDSADERNVCDDSDDDEEEKCLFCGEFWHGE